MIDLAIRGLPFFQRHLPPFITSSAVVLPFRQEKDQHVQIECLKGEFAMVSSLLLALHLAATDPAQARTAYMSCLSAMARESAKNGLSKEEFDAAVANACKTEEAAFRKISVDFDVSRGIGRRVSEDGVGDEIEDIRLSAKERFDLESESARPPE